MAEEKMGIRRLWEEKDQVIEKEHISRLGISQGKESNTGFGKQKKTRFTTRHLQPK